jgi:hypothetical protein
VGSFLVNTIDNNTWKIASTQGNGPSSDTDHHLVHYQDKLVVLGGCSTEQFEMYTVNIGENL